jgi:hypothetical protein
MKELDKAILNNDITRIIFLLKDNIDCKGAVLFHLKEKLIPEHFTEEELLNRGAIFSMEALQLAIPEYLQQSILDIRYETYLKRLYLGLQSALKAWEQGAVANKDLEAEWNKKTFAYLTKQWIEGKFPNNLQDYSAQKIKSYIAEKHLQWEGQSLQNDEVQVLDSVVKEAITNNYWVTEEGSLVIKQIEENILDQLVEYYHEDKENKEYEEGIKQFIYERIMAQIYDSSINQEMIKEFLEQEKEKILQGKVVFDQRPHYTKAIYNLLVNWQKRALEVNVSYDVTAYIRNQLQSYKLPGKLKTILVEMAINQLLKQYKDRKLSPELMENLNKQFEVNITGYYETCALKETEFRHELIQAIIKDLIDDWKNKKLSPSIGSYLQENLIADIRAILKSLGFYTLRPSATYIEINQLKEEIRVLKEELAALKTLPLHRGEESENRKPTTSDSASIKVLPEVGMFKPEQRQQPDLTSKETNQNKAEYKS